LQANTCKLLKDTIEKSQVAENARAGRKPGSWQSTQQRGLLYAGEGRAIAKATKEVEAEKLATTVRREIETREKKEEERQALEEKKKKDEEDAKTKKEKEERERESSTTDTKKGKKRKEGKR
jgi:hypothetical protein